LPTCIPSPPSSLLMDGSRKGEWACQMEEVRTKERKEEGTSHKHIRKAKDLNEANWKMGQKKWRKGNTNNQNVILGNIGVLGCLPFTRPFSTLRLEDSLNRLLATS
jgi:hypothetical protein